MMQTVCWFSCGATSAVATKIALEHDPSAQIVYIDTGAEHPDNARFLSDCERWYKRAIRTIRSDRFLDTWAVWEHKRYIAGIAGAPCTLELKKAVRENYEQQQFANGLRHCDLIQVFGFDSSEKARASRFQANQPEVFMHCPLIDAAISKDECFLRLQEAGIALPAMYMLGYANNNCIGCPKGNAGYWNKIRRDFPAVFNRMAKLERDVGATLCQATINGKRQRVKLDELPESAGRYSDEPPISCGLLCEPVAQVLMPSNPLGKRPALFAGPLDRSVRPLCE